MTPSTRGFPVPSTEQPPSEFRSSFIYLMNWLAWARSAGLDGREPLTIDAAIHDAVMAQRSMRLCARG
jgi:hypothetical protein